MGYDITNPLNNPRVLKIRKKSNGSWTVQGITFCKKIEFIVFQVPVKRDTTESDRFNNRPYNYILQSKHHEITKVLQYKGSIKNADPFDGSARKYFLNCFCGIK